MILQSLMTYYESMAEKGMMSKFGWSKSGVSYAVNLSDAGEVREIYPLMQEIETKKGKKTAIPRDMEMPIGFSRAGIAPKANFLCDNAKFIFGTDPAYFERSKKIHQDVLSGTDSVCAKAILNFYDTFDPDNARMYPVLKEQPPEFWTNGNITFMVNGVFACEDASVRCAWEQYYQNLSDTKEPKENIKMRCLLTGELVEPMRIHSKIMGVPGAQTMGAAVVSFNARSFESYGRDEGQNLNAPIGKYGAFAYTTALNTLIADKKHNKLFGDTLLLYWADDAETAYQDVFGAVFDPDSQTISDGELNDLMGKIIRGQAVVWDQVPLNPSNHFNILGISPNAARLSVRFFYADSFGSMLLHIKEHYDRLTLVPDEHKLPQILPLWRLLNETVNPNAQDKSASPQLAGDMLRAILTGQRYPATMYQQLQLRIRADREINHVRAAVIKAYLLKNTDSENNKEVLTMELNEETTYQPYVLGRLFAVLERIQERASGVTTIKDKYFTSAASTPAAVFPLIVDLAGKHLRKMDGGEKIYFDKLLQAMLCQVTQSYPAHHTLTEQGIFQLGYYHQKQKFFEKKTAAEAENNQ